MLGALRMKLHDNRLSPSKWSALAKPGKRLKEGDRIRFGETEDRACLLGQLDATVKEKREGGEIVLGFDLSGPMLREARDRLHKNANGRPADVSLIRMDATHLAFPDDTFHHVYAPYVVSVVPHPRRVVAEMARVCKPGGTVIVLNHFGSRHPVGRWVEKRLSPLTHRVGFRLDLPVDSVLGLPELSVEDHRRVNMLKLWRLIVFRKAERPRNGNLARAI